MENPPRDGSPEKTKLELGDWQTDWLYALVLQNAEGHWQQCDREANAKHWRYVLIAEWSSAEGSRCTGKVIRAWTRDERGLNEISLQEYSAHRRKIHGRIYPFIQMSFHIYPDRKYVALGVRQASTAGLGFRYLVTHDQNQGSLTPHPTGGFWIS